MKYYTTFILCFILPIIFCDELGGIKVGINDKFISNVIRDFEPELRKVLDESHSRWRYSYKRNNTNS